MKKHDKTKTWKIEDLTDGKKHYELWACQNILNMLFVLLFVSIIILIL